MPNKELQEQRMKGYFIQSTKELLRGEGLRAVSVRNIAEQAGYSYATLYNYFRDVNDLIFECVKDFQEECEAIVLEETKSIPRGTERLKGIVTSYAKYFVQYPGIFELFFIERVSDISRQTHSIDLIDSFLDRLCSEEWDYCLQAGIFEEEEAERIQDLLKYTVTGLLLFYINRKKPETYADFIRIMDGQMNHLLQRGG